MEKELISLTKYLSKMSQRYSLHYFDSTLMYSEKQIFNYCKKIILKKIKKYIIFDTDFLLLGCYCMCGKIILINENGNPINDFIPYVVVFSKFEAAYKSCIKNT